MHRKSMNSEGSVMPNVAAILKEEIVRLARKEIKREHAATRKVIARQRKEIADLKLRLSALTREVSAGARRRPAAPPAQGDGDEPRVRFSARGLQSMRARLGLTAGDFAKLVGVSAQSVYNWENEHSSPRASQRQQLAALRTVGKREAQARLEALASAHPAPARRRSKRKG
jgi:DNA-binding transcriptional regulator YiaG